MTYLLSDDHLRGIRGYTKQTCNMSWIKGIMGSRDGGRAQFVKCLCAPIVELQILMDYWSIITVYT